LEFDSSFKKIAKTTWTGTPPPGCRIDYLLVARINYRVNSIGAYFRNPLEQQAVVLLGEAVLRSNPFVTSTKSCELSGR